MKKYLATVVALVVVLMAISAGSSKNPNPCDDVNQDGEVNWSDVFVVYGQFIFHKDAPDLRADVNDDGEVTGEDVKAVYAALPLILKQNFPAETYYYFIVTGGHIWRDSDDNWLVEPVDRARVDFNGDTLVDIVDLVMWGQRYDMDVNPAAGKDYPFLVLVDVVPNKKIDEDDGLRVSDYISTKMQVPESYLKLKYLGYRAPSAPDIPDLRIMLFPETEKLSSSWGRMKTNP